MWKPVFWWRSSSYRCCMRDVAPMAHFVRRLIALTVELERECPCQLSRRPFRDFSEACSHKKTARKGRSCWLAIAAAKSCFACVNHRSASLSSRCAVLLCSWWNVWRTFPLWSAKQFSAYEFFLARDCYLLHHYLLPLPERLFE